MTDVIQGLSPETPDDDLLAAELAFGLLEPAARIAAERRVATDVAFAGECRVWQARAIAFLDGGAQTPPDWMWPAIDRRLPANDTGGDATRGWKVATALAASLALVLGTTLILRPAPPPQIVRQDAPRPRPLVAVLASAERGDIVAVDYDPVARRLSAVPEALNIATFDAELWVIPVGGAPVSLGVIAAGERTSRVAPAATRALLVPGSTLAISLEPRGGSPTGAPTGAVILTGKIARS